MARQLRNVTSRAVCCDDRRVLYSDIWQVASGDANVNDERRGALYPIRIPEWRTLSVARQ